MQKIQKAFCSLLVFVCGLGSSAYAFDEAVPPAFANKLYSTEFSKQLEAKFGESCSPRYCENMLQIVCFGGKTRGKYYVNEALEPFDASCPGACENEPKAWNQCMQVKSYKGEPAGLISSAKVKLKYGSRCSIEQTCDEMFYVDCGAAADGPAYYLDEYLSVIGTSGGLCMAGNCSGPPPQWKKCTRAANEKLKFMIEKGDEEFP